MIRWLCWLCSACILATPGMLVSEPVPTPGAGVALSDLLPDGALATVHIPGGSLLWDCPAASELRELAEELGALADVETLRAAVTAATRTDPAQTLRFLLGGELELALYESEPTRLESGDSPRPRRFLGIARTTDAEQCRLALDALLAIADGEHDVTRRKYRSRSYARIDRKLLAASVDELLLLSNDDDLLAGAMDRRLDADGAIGVDTDAPAATPPDGASLLSFRFDTALLHEGDLRAAQRPGRRLLGKRLAKPLANLLFGGLTLGEGVVQGALRCTDDELTLDALLPELPDDAPAAWFPPGADIQNVPVTPETLAVLHARRDLADWWRQRETLMSEESQPGLAEADKNLGILFGGRSPAEDVFAQLGPELALVVDRQRFDGAEVVPDVRLPGFCLVARTSGGKPFTDSLAVAFQSLVSVLNGDRAREQRAPFLLDVVAHEGVTVRTARLVPGSRGDADPRMLDNNFSPSVAVADDWLLVGSSLEQLQRLITALHGGEPPTRAGNFGLDVDVARALVALAENRAPLVANRILEEGADVETAGRDIDNLLRMAALLTRVRGTLTRSDDGLRMELRLALAGGAP